ncbi:MAG TPA: alpha/beta hydrolase [Allosphingosinicella sp.]|jgi:pimeloyl-ACP methyl ester carboxylesterase
MNRRYFIACAGAGLIAACTTTRAASAFASRRISVTTRGRGPDVVLVHGLTSSRDIWNATVAEVPGYRYHLVQINGFAGTPADGNAGEGPLLAPLAQEIANYIREARLQRPALIGHSMGGSLVMMVAARHPELASKVMVVDMLPFMGILFGPPGTTAESLGPLAAQARDRILAATEEARRASIQATIATMVKSEPLRSGPVSHAIASDRAVAARGMHDLLVTDLRPELPRIGVPLKVLWVRAPNSPLDEAQLEAVYRSSFAAAPRAEITNIPDSYHFIMLDQPGRFAEQVRAFLAA